MKKPRAATPRRDGGAKTDGSFLYGVDLSRPHMLHAKLRRSELPHAAILSVDTSEARRLPGVRAVLTGSDIGDFRASRFVRDEPVLARDRVRYAGEPVAAVAAETPEIAARAVDLIRIEYEPLPVLTDPSDAMEPGAFLIHPDWEGYKAHPALRRQGNVLNHATLRRGDLEAVLADAPHVFRDSFHTQMVHQASLEGRVAIAEWAGDRVHVWSSHQFPFGLRQDLSDILRMPLENIRVTATGLGGGFGGKLYAGVEPICILLAREAGRAVRLAHTREEEFIATSPRMAATIHITTAVDSAGTFLARQASIVYDSGAYSESSPAVISVGVLTLPGPYRWQAVRVDAYAVYTNKAGCGSYRGPGAPQAVFAGESQIDIIAQHLDIDPLELRLRNALGDGDRAPNGQVVHGSALTETLQRTAERMNWATPLPRGHGRGIACCWWTTAGGVSSARLEVDTDGVVTLVTGATEIGTGAVQGGLAGIAAGELGIDPDQLQIVAADTDDTPYDNGAQGSRTTAAAGRAVMAAAEDLRAQALALAAEKLGCDAGELQLFGGRVSSRRDPDLAVELRDLARISPGGLAGQGWWEPPVDDEADAVMEGTLMTVMNTPSFSAHGAEVTVDTGTGETRLVRYVVAQDVGRVLEPVLAEGQLAGGAVQGIGYALYEELAYRGGKVVNPNFTDYKLPTLADVPDIETILVEHPTGKGPDGAKGVGEPSIIPPAAAIANAIDDAVGVRVRRLPLTAERILTTLHQGREEP